MATRVEADDACTPHVHNFRVQLTPPRTHVVLPNQTECAKSNSNRVATECGFRGSEPLLSARSALPLNSPGISRKPIDSNPLAYRTPPADPTSTKFIRDATFRGSEPLSLARGTLVLNSPGVARRPIDSKALPLALYLL